MSIQYCIRDENLVIRETNTDSIIWKGKPNGHPVETLMEIPEAVDCMVLLEYWADGNRFNNLLRINPDGSILWKAELPSDTGVDAYVKVEWQSKNLVAWSWSGFMVTLDQATGKILTRDFKK